MQSIALYGIGACTPLGNSARATAVALRAKLNRFRTSRFVGSGGEAYVWSTTDAGDDCWGVERISEVVRRSLADLRAQRGIPAGPWVTSMTLASDMSSSAWSVLRQGVILGCKAAEVVPANDSDAVGDGRTALLRALDSAERRASKVPSWERLLLCVDTLVARSRMIELMDSERLLSPQNPNGLIPGEAAVAVLIGAKQPRRACAEITGIELRSAHSTNQPNSAAAWCAAVDATAEKAGVSADRFDGLWTDINLEADAFDALSLLRMSSLGSARGLANRIAAECVGDCGAATAAIGLLDCTFNCTALGSGSPSLHLAAEPFGDAASMVVALPEDALHAR